MLKKISVKMCLLVLAAAAWAGEPSGTEITSVHYPVDIHIPLTDRIPLLDGRIGTVEWNIAPMQDIAVGPQPSPLRMAHGAGRLWLAADHGNDPELTPFDQLVLYFDDEGGETPPFLNDGAFGAVQCGDSGEGEIDFLMREEPQVDAQNYIAGPLGCGFEFRIASSRVGFSDDSGHVQIEASTRLDDRLRAAMGDVFGVFVGMLKGETFTYGAALIPPAVRRQPSAYQWVRLDRLRTKDIAVPVSAQIIQGSEEFSVNNLVNGSGLTVEQFGRHQGFENDNWVTHAFSPDYFGAGAPDPIIQFDLGRDSALSGVLLWNYSFGSGGASPEASAARDIRIQFASAADGPDEFSDDLSGAIYLVAAPPEGGAAPSNYREEHLFSEIIIARYVRMTIQSNYAGTEGFVGGARVGLGEIAFISDNDLFSDSFEDLED